MFSIVQNILDCGCNEYGSNSNSCNSGGECDCKKNVSGTKCTHCSTDFFGFPNCKGKILFGCIYGHPFTDSNVLACNCNINGAISTSCDTNGVCQCTENAIGDKCEYCKETGYYPVPDCNMSKI